MYYCKVKDNCPYLRYRSTAEVLAENDYWKERVDHMQETMKLAEEKILSLEHKIKLLEEEKEST